MSTALPAWCFDIVDDDSRIEHNQNLNTSVFEELDINPSSIFEIIFWMLKSPLYLVLKCFPTLTPMESHGSGSGSGNWTNCHSWLLRHFYSCWNRMISSDYNTHPIKLISSRNRKFKYRSHENENSQNDNYTGVDIWGPVTVVTLYASLLWLAGQKNVPHVYVIWPIGALTMHLTCRPFLSGSSISFHLSILGYSLVPTIPLCSIIFVYQPSITSSTVLQFVCVLWSSTSALLSYNQIIKPLIVTNQPSDRRKMLLLIPLVFLFELYIITLMPMRRWQINNGHPVRIY